MDQDDARDEDIVSARIEGTSLRALAKQYGCTGREIEDAIDRRLSYELDQRQRLRLVKLSVARIESLMLPFYERATKDRDVAAGTLCCKLEERLALLLGLDHPTQSRVDVYAVEAQKQPTQYEQIRAAIMRVVESAPPAQRAAIKRMEELGFDKALELLNAGNGAALAPSLAPSADDTDGNGNGSASPDTEPTPGT
jgi:hypothetical protein